MKGFTRVSLEVNLICPEPFVDKQKYSEEVNYIEIEFPPKNREEIWLPGIRFVLRPKKQATTKGLEPSIFRSEVGRLIH